MKRAAVFFDRDNTLIASDGYLGDPSAVKLIDGAAQAVSRAHTLGFAVITVSNQSGVAKGLFPEEAVHAVNARLDELLRQADAQAMIDRHEFCPFHPQAVVERYRLDSDLRKPKPGMLIRAAKMLDLDLSQSWMIGDAPRDIQAGQAAGCRTILFQPADVTPSPDASAELPTPPDATVKSLSAALDYIAAQMPPAPNPAAPLPVATNPSAPNPPAQIPSSHGEPVTADAPFADIAPIQIKTPNADPQSPDNSSSAPLSRLERIAEQILQELHRRNTRGTVDFSVSKLLAGVSQAIAIAALVGAYFLRDRALLEPCLLVALTLQVLTLTLLSMGRDA